MTDLLLLRGLERYRAVGPFLLRLFVGFVLVYGTQDNVLHAERMLEFQAFLETNGFPAPRASAFLSAYAQFVAGWLILVGAAVRPAALIMVVNFLVALGMVHVGLPFSANISALAMLFGSLFLLFYGAGRWSVDAAWVERRTGEPARAG